MDLLAAAGPFLLWFEELKNVGWGKGLCDMAGTEPGSKGMKRDEIIQYLRKFREINKDRYQIVRLGLFGSAARNSMTESSDIDIVVELGTPDIFLLIGIKQELEEQLHCPVDIVRYRKKMNAFLKNRIDQEALYV